MKKVKNKQGKRASMLAKAENLKLKEITVQNAEGEPETKATILVQNHINYTPKVSVIIPVYNVEEYLRQCLDSVINQTLKEIEIICVDDGSTDSSLEILKEYAAKDHRITVITQQNLHAGVARNAGLAVAKGEYVHFIDSDDWIALNTYEKLYQLAQTRNVEILKFKSYTFDNIEQNVSTSYFTEMQGVSQKLFNSFLTLEKDYKELINVSDAPWSGIYYLDFLKKHQIFFDNLLCANDTSFFYRCLINMDKLYLSNEHFVYYRINNSKSLIGIRVLHFDCMINQYNIIMNLVKKCDAKIANCIQKHLIHAILYRYSKYLQIKTITNELQNRLYKEIKNWIYNENITNNMIGKDVIDIFNTLKNTISVSIIVPVYNTEKYLKECMDSLVNQSLKNIEIICINDASTDGSLEILKSYAKNDQRIRIINNTKNLGAPGAVKNIGLKVARGEYIGFVDSDDYVDINYFEELYNKAKSNDAEIASCLCLAYIQKNKSNKKQINCSEEVLITPEDKEKLISSQGSNCTKIYSKKMLEKYNISCFEQRSIAEDNFFSVITMCLANKISTTSTCCYYYRKHDASITSHQRTKDDFSIFEVYKQIDIWLDKNKFYPKYKQCVTKRKSQDFTWFYNDLNSKYIDEFKIKLKSTFPEIYEKMFNIIISLTSYPDRINTIHQTIESLLNQSMKASKIILWLAPEQFPNKEADLPKSLLALKEKGLTIDWYHDIRSYKKLLPTLKKYPEAIIVTADDDNIYQYNWLKKLYENYLKFPNDIQCHRVTKFIYNGSFNVITGGFSYYKGASYLNKLVGLGGVLYPPHCFYKDILNEDLIKKLAPTNDDQWFWFMAMLNKVKIRVVDNADIEAHYIEGTQEKGLCKINDKGQNLFWRDFNNMLRYYPQIKKIMLSENKKYTENFQYLGKYRLDLENFYKKIMHKTLNLNNPQTFNEKIQWLKLYDSTPIKTKLADKYLVRDWVKEKIGEKYLITLLGVYDKFEEIDFDKLPNQFVIKCNHGSGWNIIVKDKSKLNLAETKEKLDKWLKTNFAFKYGYELHYRDIKPKIIIEKYVSNDGKNLYDYKFWCFNGNVKYMQFRNDFSEHLEMCFYDLHWKKQPFYYDHPLYKPDLPKPDNFSEMVNIAQKLCKGFAFVCVDLYRLNDGSIKFGEMTFTRSSGTGKWCDEKYNYKLGQLIKLPELAYNIDSGEYYKLPHIPTNNNKTPKDVLLSKSILSYKLFNFLPLFTFNQRNERKVWKILGLPIFKIQKLSGFKTKYYVLGIPVLKTIKR